MKLTHPFLPSFVYQTLLGTTLYQAYFQIASLGLVRKGGIEETPESRVPGMGLSLIYALPC